MNRLPFTHPSHLAAAVDAVRRAAQRHGVVALPTETFYGLAVPPADHLAVTRIFLLKHRPGERALPVVAASPAQLAELVVVPEPWRSKLEAVWPAPLTVVLPARRTGGKGTTLAVRVPDHDLLRALLAEVGPRTATSANRSGEAPLASADAVAEALGGGLELLLDGGDTPGGRPSTLVDLTSDVPRLLRRGAWEPPREWGLGSG